MTATATAGRLMKHATVTGTGRMEPTPKRPRTRPGPSSVVVVRNINDLQMPPTRLVKPSKSFSPTAPVPASVPVTVADLKTEDGAHHDQVITTVPNPAAPSRHASPTAAMAASSPVGRARVLSVTQAMAKSEMTAGHTVLSSQWFRHPECALGVWWRMCGELKDGRIKVDLCVSTFDNAHPVRIALCAVQIRIVQTTSSGTLSSCFPFKDSSCSLEVDGKGRGLRGGETQCHVDGLESLVLTMTIAYLEVPAHLRCQGPAEDATSSMFDSKEFSSVNVVLDNGEAVLAHKAVLGRHSAMLKAMFADSMHETSPTRLHVTGVSMDVLTTMLRYMYTGVVKMEQAADRDATVSLLYLADRFSITKLKQFAELALVDFLQSVESDLLQVAMSTQASFLLQVILVRLSVLAGFGSGAGTSPGAKNKEAEFLTETLRTNPNMLTDYFRLNSVAMAPIFKAFSARDTKALLRSST